MPTLTRIFGNLFDAEGNTITSGVVSMRLQQSIISVDGTLVAPFIVEHDFSVASLFDVDVYATIGAYPEGVAYFVEYDPDPDDTSRPASQKDGYWRNYWEVANVASVALGTFLPALRGEPNFTPSSVGSVGSGTVGTIAKWVTINTLGNSNISESGATTTVTGALTVTGAVTGGTYNGQTISSSASFTGSMAVAGAINGQTISSIAQFTGTLAVAGATNLTGGVASHLIPTATDLYDLGRFDRLWGQGFISTLNAIVFKETTATVFGGYSIIAKQVGSFAADVASAATTINFGQAMTDSDWVQVRAHDTSGVVRMEYIFVISQVSGTTYNVSRDLSGHHSPDPAWASGTPFIVLGQNGAGRIELLAADGKPRITFVQQGASHNTQTDRVVIGNLKGYFDYPGGGGDPDVHGFAAGSAAGAWIKIDPTNGIRIGHNTNTRVQIDASGNASFTGAVTATSGSFTGSITAASGTVGGWTISSDALQSGSGATNVGMYSGGSSTVRFWAGSGTLDSAPFRVTSAGVLTASNVNIAAGGVTLDSAGLFISPVSAGGGGSYANTNAVRWTNSNALRTAIWRSDVTSGTIARKLYIDNWQSQIDTVETEIQMQCIQYTSGLDPPNAALGYGWANLQQRSKTQAAETLLLSQAYTATTFYSGYVWLAGIGGSGSARAVLAAGSPPLMTGAGGTPGTPTSYFEASGTTAIIGGTTINLAASVYMDTSKVIYPGTVNGLSAYQSSYYLASASNYNGLYTNGTFLAAGNIYTTSGFFVSDLNGGGVKVMNAAGSSQLQIIGLDGSNLTFIHCNSARLRFVGGSLSSTATSGAGGATPANVGTFINVTVDGYGNAKIPIYPV
jgi:hypothetical protein